MKNGKPIGSAAIALGIALLVVSLMADSLGIGNASGLGWKQIAGGLGGAVLAVIGGVVLCKK